MIAVDDLVTTLDAKRSGAGWLAKCPAHSHVSNRRSLSIGEGKDGKVLLKCFSGCTFEEIVGALHLDAKDLMPPPEQGKKKSKIVATYPYYSETGELLYERVRFQPKDFRLRRPDGSGGVSWSLNGTRRVPYRLPQLLAAIEAGRTVLFLEGEKDSENVVGLGFDATTAGGSKDWRREFSQFFGGADVVILPHNDTAGESYAVSVATDLLPVAGSVRVLTLPGLPPAGDVSDYIAAGHGREDLLQLVQGAQDAGEWLATLSPEETPGDSDESEGTILEWIEHQRQERPRLSDAALHGLAGDFVRAVGPYTEADPAGILLSFLIEAGCSIGYGPHFWIGNTRHGVNEFGLLVGPTSTGRKGTAQDEAEYPFAVAGPEFAPRIASGLSSGEGLIYQVRDAVMTTDEDGAETVEDAGQPDKRLLVREAEFARVLKAVERQGNTLSPIVRLAWDGKTLENLTKNSPHRSTAPHICIVAQITPSELKRLLTESEVANGLGNRFLLAYVERDKLLPEGDRAPAEVLTPIVGRLQEALSFARTVEEMRRTEGARKAWRKLYGPLSANRQGLCGAMTDRGVPHVVRLAMIYALLDQQDQVDIPHLKAAVALWEYAERSVRYIFGNGLGDSAADDIDAELSEHPEGMTRTQIMDHFRGHVYGARLDSALDLLAGAGLARRARVKGKGRPAEKWFSTRPSGESGQSGESATEAA